MHERRIPEWLRHAPAPGVRGFAVLAGIELTGDGFFYQNPLESDGSVERSEYFEVACCPANFARLMAQVPGLVYARSDDTLFAKTDGVVKYGSRRGRRHVSVLVDSQ